MVLLDFAISSFLKQCQISWQEDTNWLQEIDMVVIFNTM